VRLRKRKLIGYLACALLFAGGVALSIRLSFPSDPALRRFPRGSRAEVDLTADSDTITVSAPGAKRRYRLYGTDRGIVAREVERGARDEPADDAQ
jgi:endonuclease YncB( thermonuclease family)